jgi:mannobiose 2-epimerase
MSSNCRDLRQDLVDIFPRFCPISKRKYLQIAQRAFDYLNSAFWDKEYQCFSGRLTRQGNPVSDRKQYYAQAFGIYGYSEFFLSHQDQASLERAIQLTTS